jgi:hypothetical protein
VILESKSRRRWFGALCLLAAIGMLVAGETVLKDRLSQLAFFLYWFGCLGFTILALLTALADAHVLRQETRHRQRALLENTLEEIESEKEPRE